MRPSPEGTGICHPDEPSSRPGDLSRAERAVVHPLVAAGLVGGGGLDGSGTRRSEEEVLRILVRIKDLTLILLTTSSSVDSRTRSLK